MNEPDDTPIFQRVLGDGWSELGEVVQRHYFLRSGHADRMTVIGTMAEVRAGPVARLTMPLARIVGALVPYQGTDVPVAVHYEPRPDDAALYWDRVFRFPGRKPYHFRSHMVANGPAEVIEFVRFGVGLRLAVTAEDGALVFRDLGYVWRIAGVDVPLPARLLLGRAYVEERPIAGEPDRFTMRMTLRHPLFGEMFAYSGTFQLPSEAG